MYHYTADSLGQLARMLLQKAAQYIFLHVCLDFHAEKPTHANQGLLHTYIHSLIHRPFSSVGGPKTHLKTIFHPWPFKINNKSLIVPKVNGARGRPQESLKLRGSK